MKCFQTWWGKLSAFAPLRFQSMRSHEANDSTVIQCTSNKAGEEGKDASPRIVTLTPFKAFFSFSSLLWDSAARRKGHTAPFAEMAMAPRGEQPPHGGDGAEANPRSRAAANEMKMEVARQRELYSQHREEPWRGMMWHRVWVSNTDTPEGGTGIWVSYIGLSIARPRNAKDVIARARPITGGKSTHNTAHCCTHILQGAITAT